PPPSTNYTLSLHDALPICEVVSRTPQSYRDFIQQSRAEFSIPKNGYVKMRGGWFSDRSVCYLASGRPVLIKDTGLGDWLPVGNGDRKSTRLNSSHDQISYA